MNRKEGRDGSINTLLEYIKEKLFNRNVLVFSFFLLLSFVFWFINALSNDMSSSVNYPVRYINFPENLALINELPYRLSLEVYGPGYSIFKSRIGDNKVPLIIDVNNSGIPVRENRSELEYYVYTLNLRESFRRQLRNDLNINSVLPDTIHFAFDKLISKKVPVKPDLKINLQRQYMVNGEIVIEPDSVEITGPGAVIDTTEFVLTEFHEFNQINQRINRNLDIRPIRKVEISHRKVQVTIPVEQFTEDIIDVRIRVLNKPDTANVRLFPDAVNIHFNIALSDYSRIQEIPIEAVVDMKNLNYRTVDRLNVEIINLPPYISNVRYNPKQVEYIIEKL